jgi:uncharacterized membrane protein YhdT
MAIVIALIYLLAVILVVWLVARFLAQVLPGPLGNPPWLPSGIYLIAALIVILYFLIRTLPILIHALMALRV